MSSTSRKDSEIEVGVHRSNAPYNAAQTAWGRDEKQTITTSTDIQSEIQVCSVLIYTQLVINEKGNSKHKHCHSVL